MAGNFSMWDIGGSPGVQRAEIQGGLAAQQAKTNYLNVEATRAAKLIPSDIALKHAQAQEEELKVQQMQGLMQAMKTLQQHQRSQQQGQQTGLMMNDMISRGQNAVDMDLQLSNLYATHGFTKQALDASKAALEGMSKLSTIHENLANAEDKQLTTARDEYGWLAGGLQSVHDPAGLMQLNMQFMQRFGKPSPLSNVPYSPALVREVQARAMTVSQALTARSQEIKNNLTARRDAEMKKYHQSKLKVDKLLSLSLVKSREDKVGSGSLAPSSNDVKAATAILDEGLGSASMTMTDAEKTAISMRIISEAKRLRRQNPALSGPQAMLKAFANERQQGTFNHIGAMAGKTPATYLPQPATAAGWHEGYYYKADNPPYKGMIVQVKDGKIVSTGIMADSLSQ